MNARRWVVTGPRALQLEEFVLADPQPGELLVRTEASLVSAGTELAIFTGIHQGLSNPEATWPKYPQPMGYMAAARVIAVGPDVTAWRPGDRVLTSSGHASHALVPTGAGRHCWRLPVELAAERAVFARMAKTAMTAVVQAQVTVGQAVAVVGLGIIGQVALRLFEAAGSYPVVGIDSVAARRAAALRGGAALAIDPGREDPRAALASVAPGGADIVVDATGVAAALPGAMRLAADGGQVVVLGSPRGTAPDVDFYHDLHRRSLRVVGAHDSGIGAAARERFPWTNDRIVPLVIDWVRREKVPVADLISHLVIPAALPEMYSGLLDERERFLGVVLRWGEAG
jgi:2-desacetyl-2-hydroxyethyl bacteriochlorophyllide A dehydrogenase